MHKNFSILLMTVSLLTACADDVPVPVIRDYDFYEVDVKELSGLCMDPDGTFMFACGDKGVVKSLSFSGESSEVRTYSSDMEGISVNPVSGDIYLAIEGTQEIHCLEAPDYKEQSVLFKVHDAATYDNSGLEAVEYYKDDILLVGSQKGANLWQYRLDGTMVSNISLSDFASEVAGLCYDDKTGNLWVVDSKKAKIFVCSVTGELYATYDIPYVDNAESICIDRDRNCVWVGSDEDSSKLYKINFDF